MPRWSLEEWLRYQEQLHSREIDLGLDRLYAVLPRLLPEPLTASCILVGGTNGKGSTVAYLESIYRQAGYQTAAYTSPHLLRYNERIRLKALPVEDEALIEAFEQVETARGDVSLSYFEFGTLAALWLFAHQSPDVMLLEVGLGGRLDAVNIVEPDVSIITNIAMDHTEWLGHSLDQIGREKAGIARGGKPVIIGEADPPAGMLTALHEVGADELVLHRDFGFSQQQSRPGWRWYGQAGKPLELPLPALPGSHQLNNAACALQAIECLSDRLPVAASATQQGLQETSLAGRFQVLQQAPQVVVDVAHNPAAAVTLHHSLARQPVEGRTLAVFAMLNTREPEAVMTELHSAVDAWYVCPLTVTNSHTTVRLAQAAQAVGVAGPVNVCESVAEALEEALATATVQDRILVCGSFLTVAEAMAVIRV